jgi:hypothetical protein
MTKKELLKSKYWMSSAFKEKIFEPCKSGKLPVLHGTFKKLKKPMWDSEITKEFHIEPKSIEEIVGTLIDLTSKQLNGEAGTLLTNGYTNIFYAKAADGRTVAVFALWHGAQWWFNCREFGEDSTFGNSSTLVNFDALTEEQAIDFLKNRGFKISKEF